MSKPFKKRDTNEELQHKKGKNDETKDDKSEMGSNKGSEYTFKKLGKSNIDYIMILAQESNKKIAEAVVEATGRTETEERGNKIPVLGSQGTREGEQGTHSKYRNHK